MKKVLFVILSTLALGCKSSSEPQPNKEPEAIVPVQGTDYESFGLGMDRVSTNYFIIASKREGKSVAPDSLIAYSTLDGLNDFHKPVFGLPVFKFENDKVKLLYVYYFDNEISGGSLLPDVAVRRFNYLVSKFNSTYSLTKIDSSTSILYKIDKTSNISRDSLKYKVYKDGNFYLRGSWRNGNKTVTLRYSELPNKAFPNLNNKGLALIQTVIASY